MSHMDRVGLALVAGLVATTTIITTSAQAQGAQSQESAYRLVDGWAQLPNGVDAWGQTIGLDIDADGNLWVFHRCFATSCNEGREDVTPVLKYDPSGRIVNSWGEGMFIWPSRVFSRRRRQRLDHGCPWGGREGPPGFQVHSGR